MTNELEKIDLLRARMGINYKEAKEVLEEANGDLVQALIILEKKSKGAGTRIRESSEGILERVRSLFERLGETRIKIKHDEHTVMEIPATLGTLGLLGTIVSSELALLAALGAVIAMTKNYSLEIERNQNN